MEVINRRMFVFDYDGVLVDSYSCLPDVYRSIAQKLGLDEESTERFVAKALEYEDYYDYIKIYDRLYWWPQLFSEYGVNMKENELKELFYFYHLERTRRSKILPSVIEVLEGLRDRGKVLAIVAGDDGLKGLKRRRIIDNGLDSFFDEILIVKDDVANRKEAIEILMIRYNVRPSEIAFFDDKPDPINRVKMYYPEVLAVRVLYKGILRKAWEGSDVSDVKIEGIGELAHIFCSK